MSAIAAATYMQVNTSALKKVLVLGLIISIFYDVTSGPIRSSSYNLNIFLAIAIDFITNILLNKHIKQFIENYSDHKVFSLCPSCCYDSNDITTKCSECGYDGNINNHCEATNENKSILRIVQIQDDENIKTVLKMGGLFAKNTIYENDVKVYASQLIITDKRIIIARIRGFKRGWSYRKSIPLLSVKSATEEPKTYFGKSMKSIRIELIDGNYLNIYFLRFGNNDRENQDLLDYI
jgi:hypothetical protein